MNKAVELLYNMVNTYSPSRQENRVAAYLVNFMHANGFTDAYRDAIGNVIGEIGSGEKTLLVCGHIDTVPGQLPVKIQDNKLYGRGSVDAKGSLASLVMGALEAQPLTSLKVVVLGTVEEELDGIGVHSFLQHYRDKVDYIIVGEPNQWDRINVGYKGNISIDYDLVKPITHTAFPEPTAIEEALVFSNLLRRWAKDFNVGKEKAFEQLHFSIRSINSASDGLHETIQFGMNFRTPLDFEFSDLKQFIAENQNGATVYYHGQEQAIRSDKSNELVRAYLQAIRNEGSVPRFVVKTGTSDMNALGAHFKGVPIVTYGPGDSGLDHTPGEHLPLDEYEKAISVIRAVIQQLAQT
ncbi:MAG: M20/M25/M40 family metallo-hydrolase [bacterium]